MKYSREELIKIAQEEYNKNGKLVCGKFLSKNGLPHYQTYYNEFGNWHEVQKIIIGGNNIRKERKLHTKESILEDYIKLANEISATPNTEQFGKIVSITTVLKYYEKFSNLTVAAFGESKRDGAGYSKDFLVCELNRFVDEFSRIPVPSDFNNLFGYPSRKTFYNVFGTFNNALIEAKITPSKLDMQEYRDVFCNKEFLESIVFQYVDEYSKVPTFKELTIFCGKEFKKYYNAVFGSWNDALKSMGLSLNQISKHDDSFLESEFHRFVKENGRVPTYSEFNKSNYPSFWCYQNRFGSWNNAVTYYGYETNDNNRKYYLENGEVCASSYEHIVSTWLQNKNIQYERNIKYRDFIESYTGKMDCDYKITTPKSIWYIEVAGFLSEEDFNKISREEQVYYFKLKYKKKMLKENSLNHIIIKPKHMKQKTMEEIFTVILEELA